MRVSNPRHPDPHSGTLPL